MGSSNKKFNSQLLNSFKSELQEIKIWVRGQEKYHQLKEFLSSVVKFFTLFYPVFAPLLFVFFQDEIIVSTNGVIKYLRANIGFNLLEKTKHSYHISTVTISFWGSFIIWMYVYFRTIVGEDKSNKQNLRTLKSAILRSPNPRMFKEYIMYYKVIIQGLDYLKRDGVTKEDYESIFQDILSKICNLTALYTNQDDIYGANFMLCIENNFNTPYIKKLKNRKEWLHFKKVDPDNIFGVLQSFSELKFTNRSKDGKRERDIPSLILPLIKEQNGELDVSMLLPGALTAVKKGFHVFNDVLDIDGNYSHLGLGQKKIAQTYFQTIGKDIRSFVSFRILINEGSKSNGERLIGVLNIDCDETYILGHEEEYHTTFYSLISPILSQISPYLDQYLRLRDDEKIVDN